MSMESAEIKDLLERLIIAIEGQNREEPDRNLFTNKFKCIASSVDGPTKCGMPHGCSCAECSWGHCF